MADRTKGQWQLHHRILGELVAEAYSIISNETKLEVLEMIKELKARKGKEWAQTTAEHKKQAAPVLANGEKQAGSSIEAWKATKDEPDSKMVQTPPAKTGMVPWLDE